MPIFSAAVRWQQRNATARYNVGPAVDFQCISLDKIICRDFMYFILADLA